MKEVKEEYHLFPQEEGVKELFLRIQTSWSCGEHTYHIPEILELSHYLIFIIFVDEKMPDVMSSSHYVSSSIITGAGARWRQ